MLRTAKGDATRPTSDRARQGLFDWLGGALDGGRVLDLFAGSGALGLEAMSRGAAEVVFVESGRGALAVLVANVADLGLADVTRVVRTPLPRALRQLRAHAALYDWIFADPPYGETWGEALAGEHGVADVLAPGGSFVLERSRRSGVPECEKRLELRGTRIYGETAFDWFQRDEGVPQDE